MADYITNYAAFEEGRAVPAVPGYNFLQDKNIPDEDKEGWELRLKGDLGEVEGKDQDVDYYVYTGSDDIPKKVDWMKGVQKQGAIDAAARVHTAKKEKYDSAVSKITGKYEDSSQKLKQKYDDKLRDLEERLSRHKDGESTYKQKKRDVEEWYARETTKIAKEKNEGLSKLVDPGETFEVPLPWETPVKYNYKDYKDVLNDPNATAEEKAKKVQAAVNAGADVEEVKEAVKNTGDKELEAKTKNVSAEKTTVKAELHEGRGREIDEAQKALDKAGNKAAGIVGEKKVDAIKEAAEQAAKAFQSGDGANINDRLKDIAEVGRNIDPYYDEGLPRTLVGLYKQGRLGRISLTDEEKEEVVKANSFSEDEVNKLKEEGKTEEEIIKLQNAKIEKALKQKQKEISKPAGNTAAYFIIDYISKALQNIGADVAAVGGKQLSRAGDPAVKTLLDEQMKGANERYNKAFEYGLQSQGKAGDTYSEWKTSDISGETKLNQNKRYDEFTKGLDKDLAAFMNTLTIDQAKEIAKFNEEMQVLLQTDLAKKTPEAQIKGIYAAAQSGKYMDKGLLKNYATLLFDADPSKKMTAAEKWSVGLKAADTVGSIVSNVIGALK